MLRKKLKQITAISLVSSVFLVNGCTSQEQAFAAGVGTGVVVAASVYSYPRYYGYPYYYYGGRYYYGGYYRGGYYHYHGNRYRNGHYYHGGYRYYNGRRYKAQVGHHGYYKSKKQYNNRNAYKNERHVKKNVSKTERKQQQIKKGEKYQNKQNRTRNYNHTSEPRSINAQNVNRTRYR